MKPTGVKTLSDNKKLTKKQASELIKCARDVEYFIENYVRVQHPTRGAVNFELRNYQKKAIKLISENNKVILNFARQLGKTTTIAAYLLHQAIFRPDITIGICAHKGSGAKEIIGRIRYAYETLPYWIKPAIYGAYNVFDIAFDNGSRIMSQTTTETTYRGMSLTILYADEFAHVKESIVQEWWKSILPTLSAPGTKFLISSTPNGSENKFAEIYFKAEQGINDYKALTVTNEDFPEERGEKFKQEMLKDMSELEYAQEFMCQFISSSGTLIHSPILEALRPSEVVDNYNGLKIYRPLENLRLGLSVDVGTGTGQDHSVFQVFDLDKLEQVAEFRDNQLNITDLTKRLISILKYLNDLATELTFTVEANSIGQGVTQLIRNADNSIFNQIEMISIGKHDGIMTTTKTKMKGCTKFKDLIESDRMKIHSRELISELKFFVKSGASFKAESGKTDDLVMGCILMCLMLDEMSFYDPHIYDVMNSVNIIGDMEEGDGEPLPFCF